MLVYLKDPFELTGFDGRTKSSMDVTRRNRDKGDKIKTETFLDSLVRQLSVYVVTAIGLFLIIKEFLIGE